MWNKCFDLELLLVPPNSEKKVNGWLKLTLFQSVNLNSFALKWTEKKFGGAGHRSPYLSHAKRALYHLSYTPDVKKADNNSVVLD